MALPLTKLLKKDTKLPETWDASASQSVTELKMAITRYPVLRHYLRSIQFADTAVIAWDLAADPGIRIRKEESETTIRTSCF